MAGRGEDRGQRVVLGMLNGSAFFVHMAVSVPPNQNRSYQGSCNIQKFKFLK